MHQVIPSNHFRVRIGKERESVTGLLREVARLFRTVNTDRDRTNPNCFELVQASLDAPQLGVARWSPVASVKDEQYTLRRVAVDRRGPQLR